MSTRDDALLDDLAARAQQGDMVALGDLWSRCEPDVRTIVVAECRRAVRPNRVDDAYGRAREVFLFEAVPRWEPDRAPFERFMKGRVRTRVRTWLYRSSLGNVSEPEGETPPPPEPSRDEYDPSSPVPGEDRNLVASILRAFGDPTARNKWAVLRLLVGHGVSLRTTTDGLALASVDAADPVIEDARATWEAIAGPWSLLDLEIEPPPLPATWAECVDLFCPDPAGDAVPAPPARVGLDDPAERPDELQRWYERVKRWYGRLSGAVLAAMFEKK